MLFALPLPLAHAEPWDDPAGAALATESRRQALDRFLHVATPDPLATARDLGALPSDPLRDRALAVLAPEHTFVDGHPGAPLWAFRPFAELDAGSLDPVNASGLEAPGWATGTLGVDGRLYVGPLQVVARPAVRGAVAPGALDVVPEALWVAAGIPAVQAGFGTRDRWLGPSHHGTLTLSDNARPPWAGWIVGEGRLPGKARGVGRFRGELDVGFLDRPRTDVTRPGLLVLDLRWLPVSWIEVGATRMALFGGVDRPPVNLGQLLVPTEPHVYDDPDLTEADQDELAALDFRVTLPLRKWWDLPVDHVEAWWQYGGEDVIARKSGGVPYPALAGVANVYGAEVGVGPVSVSVEYARLMDDYFRWYVGHRVYHEGFTQDGRPLGELGGTDSEDLWGAVAVDPGPWRARLSVERLRRVGVIEALNDKLFAFSTDETHLRVGLRGGIPVRTGGWVDGEVEIDRVVGTDFVPGAADTRFRVAVAVTPGAWSGRLGRAARAR